LGYFMKIKKIFIYLSLVLSSITLLPSTGRAQGPKLTVKQETEKRESQRRITEASTVKLLMQEVTGRQTVGSTQKT